jgi:hypothetical protein
VLSGAGRALVLTLIVLTSGLLTIPFNLGPWGLLFPLVVMLVAGWILFRNLQLSQRDFLLGVLVAVIASLASAVIGAIGATVGGKPFAAALLDPGIGWFLGDTVSAILGLYLLALYTERLRNAGIAE